MIDKWLSKSKLNNVFNTITKKFLFEKITANQLTILGLITGSLSALSVFLSGILIWELELIICSAILLIISFFFDVLDGIIARLGQPTVFGGILDIFCDRTVEIFIIIAIVSTDPLVLVYPGLFSLAAIVLCISMFLLIGGAYKLEEVEDQRKVIYYRHGLMERSETLLFLLAITIVYFWRFILLWIFAILVFITAILRLRDAYILFKKYDSIL